MKNIGYKFGYKAGPSEPVFDFHDLKGLRRLPRSGNEALGVNMSHAPHYTTQPGLAGGCDQLDRFTLANRRSIMA